MAKYNKLWKALRMYATKPEPEKKGWTFFQNVVLTVGGGGAVHVLYNIYNTYYGPETQYALDNMLKTIVTKKYDPEMPEGMIYIKREQDDDLKAKLYENFYGRARGFFMLVGESGSGKTTMMQNLLQKEYEDGVIFVKINAVNLVAVPKKEVTSVFEEAVLRKFDECKNHPRRKHSFDDFIGHANGVWLKNQKKWRTWLRNRWYKTKEHPLIIYITLDTKDTKLEYETMQAIAVAVGGMASNLSSQANKCKTILEFSKTGISDHVQQVRGDYDDFEVNAMTETEFQEIGKQVLTVKDPENLFEPYLKHYHEWLGGHTKGLVQLNKGRNPAGTRIESATPETKDKVLEELKQEIDAEFADSYAQLLREQPEAKKLLTEIAETGIKGFRAHDPRGSEIICELRKRNSASTLLRNVTKSSVRIHRYSHALYLHGATGPKDKKARTKIEEVRKKFGMNAKSA